MSTIKELNKAIETLSSECNVMHETVYGTWEEADEIPYYPNVFERIWNRVKNMFICTNRKNGDSNEID